VTPSRPRVNQCQKPSGWLGRFVLRNMNSRHSTVTDWGLSHISVQEHDNVLDVGCGGGRTIGKLAGITTRGKVFGLDHSNESVAVACKMNRELIDTGRVEIREGSVSHLPFSQNVFDLVTAVETHFWWSDLPGDMREIYRVLKPDGMLIVIAEVYKGANTKTAKLVEKYLPRTGMTFLTPDEHRRLFINAGYSDIQIIEESHKGWICCTGRKPSIPGAPNSIDD
jgi:ubiquinone/menaquinone biosynthesis C-methylase UbiE